MSQLPSLCDSVHFAGLRAKLPDYRQQERVRNGWLRRRFETILPALMRRTGIDLWVVCCREYNEDPVLTTLVPCAMMTARRTTMLVFHLQPDGTVRPMAITRPGVGLDGYYEAMWARGAESQWECLNRVLTECAPRRIGINRSETFAFADGLSQTLYETLCASLSPENRAKLCPAEALCVGWLETRLPEEMAAYDGIVQLAHALIREAFSSRVVTPGVTTNLDVKYFMLQQAKELDLAPWFDYEVSITRAGVGVIEAETVILPGDLLHCDVGIRCLNLCTDAQENAYVLRPGETEAPPFLQALQRRINRQQDIVRACFQEGRTGNEVLALARAQASAEGLGPCIYTHPLGYHGHGAGPMIGLWDMQEGVPGTGDYPLHNDTCYALEMSCEADLPEWGVRFFFGAETELLFTGGQTYYLGGRQTALHLIR